jgi:hypothetical protein
MIGDDRQPVIVVDGLDNDDLGASRVHVCTVWCVSLTDGQVLPRKAIAFGRYKLVRGGQDATCAHDLVWWCLGSRSNGTPRGLDGGVMVDGWMARWDGLLNLNDTPPFAAI